MMDSSVPLDMWHVISNFFVVEPSSSHYEDQTLLKVYHNSLWMKQHGTITDAHLRRGSNSHTNMVVHPQKFNGKISNMHCQDNALHSKCKLNLIFQNDLGLHLGGKLDRFCWLFKITDDAHYRYEAVKRRIRQATLLPLLQPEVFSKLGIKAPSGLLLYGPSGTTNTLSHHVILFLMVHMWLGCGKTAFVQALASESMLNVISIKGYVTFFSCHAITPCSCLSLSRPEIFSKYLGETELKIRNLFATAKRIAPCIMFIDEMDAISTRRGMCMKGCWQG